MSNNEETKVSSLLGPPVGYVDILNIATNDAMAKELEGPTKFNPLRPSSAGKCTRELAYGTMEYLGKAKYAREPMGAETHRIFAVGHSFEYHLIQQFQKHAGEFFEVRYKQQSLEFFKLEQVELAPVPEELAEVELDAKLVNWIEGSNDAVFWSPEHKCLVDFKSKKDKFSSWFENNWTETTKKLLNMESVKPIGDSGAAFWVESLSDFLLELRDPFFEANFQQLNLYASHDFFLKRGIDHAAIIQVNKNDSKLREVRFRPDPALALKIGEKFKLAALAASAGNPELAPRDYMLGSMKCAFCDYKNECWPNPGSDKAADPLKLYFKTLPPRAWPKDLSRISPEVSSELEELFAELAVLEDASSAREVLEEEIVKQMVSLGERKVRLANGEVYELKHYKSPKPRVALKRGR